MTLTNFESLSLSFSLSLCIYMYVCIYMYIYIYIYVYVCIFPVLSFDSPKSTRKAKGYLMFTGGSKGNIGKKRVKNFSFQVNISSLVM